MAPGATVLSPTLEELCNQALAPASCSPLPLQHLTPCPGFQAVCKLFLQPGISSPLQPGFTPALLLLFSGFGEQWRRELTLPKSFASGTEPPGKPTAQLRASVGGAMGLGFTSQELLKPESTWGPVTAQGEAGPRLEAPRKKGQEGRAGRASGKCQGRWGSDHKELWPRAGVPRKSSRGRQKRGQRWVGRPARLRGRRGPGGVSSEVRSRSLLHAAAGRPPWPGSPTLRPPAGPPRPAGGRVAPGDVSPRAGRRGHRRLPPGRVRASLRRGLRGGRPGPATRSRPPRAPLALPSRPGAAGSRSRPAPSPAPRGVSAAGGGAPPNQSQAGNSSRGARPGCGAGAGGGGRGAGSEPGGPPGRPSSSPEPAPRIMETGPPADPLAPLRSAFLPRGRAGLGSWAAPTGPRRGAPPEPRDWGSRRARPPGGLPVTLRWTHSAARPGLPSLGARGVPGGCAPCRVPARYAGFSPLRSLRGGPMKPIFQVKAVRSTEGAGWRGAGQEPGRLLRGAPRTAPPRARSRRWHEGRGRARGLPKCSGRALAAEPGRALAPGLSFPTWEGAAVPGLCERRSEPRARTRRSPAALRPGRLPGSSGGAPGALGREPGPPSPHPRGVWTRAEAGPGARGTRPAATSRRETGASPGPGLRARRSVGAPARPRLCPRGEPSGVAPHSETTGERPASAGVARPGAGSRGRPLLGGPRRAPRPLWAAASSCENQALDAADCGSVLGPGLPHPFGAGRGCRALSFGVRMGTERGGEASSLGPRHGCQRRSGLEPGLGAGKTHPWTARPRPSSPPPLRPRAPGRGPRSPPRPPLAGATRLTAQLLLARPALRPRATGREGLNRAARWGGPRCWGGAAPSGTRATEASGGGGRKGGQAAGKGDDSSRGARIGNAATWEQPCPGRRESRGAGKLSRRGPAPSTCSTPAPRALSGPRPGRWRRGGLFCAEWRAILGEVGRWSWSERSSWSLAQVSPAAASVQAEEV
uniref:collagen alpha-1(III) chain-like n=1 Tax=Nyctereutes procyonoides TaxID=34880 RepID=UPI002443817C|nr:collagen alpha-1(III) chain-like [Nyctereutes procyonoides]